MQSESRQGESRTENEGMAAVTHNRSATSSTPFAWQTDLFLRIVSCHETESSTGSTIAPADELLPESWQ